MWVLMLWVRRFIYWYGGRPNLGSIFHSPSLHLRLQAMEAMQNFKWAEVSVLDGARMKPIKPDERIFLYDRMMWCVFCGSVLQEFVADVKECPEGCGRCYPSDDDKGLPVITVEPIGD